MGADKTVLIVLRSVALVAALAVVGLGAWSKYIVHDVEIRGASILRLIPQEPESIVQYWRSFFSAITNGGMRVWISIAAGSLSFLTSLLVILSTAIRRFETPGSVRVPLELMSMTSLAIAFGCALSWALELGTFSTTRLETSDTDLQAFTMIMPVSQGLVISAGAGSLILLITVITSMVQACLRARSKEASSFEPTASALGMGHEYQAIVPPVASSRPPSMYDPRKPLPKHLERMPETDQEKAMSEDFSKLVRVDSGRSNGSRYSDVEKKDSWPLYPERKQRMAAARPPRPWSVVPQDKRSSRMHAL